MRHVDEGDLHAWLDGALDQLGEEHAGRVREHLRVCASCREALVDEETLRARADEVLALAAPRSIEAPPFETLVERARGTPRVAPTAQPRLSRAARFGWAASIVIALGAGWMARTVESRSFDEDGSVPAGPREAIAPAPSPREAVEAGAPAVPTAGPAVPGGRDLPARESVASGAVALGAGASTAVSSGSVRASERGAPAAAPREAPAASAVVASVDPVTAPEPAAAVAPSPSVTASLVAERVQPRSPAPVGGGSLAQPTQTPRTIAVVSRRPRAGEAGALAVRSSGVGLSSGPDTTSVPGLFARGRPSGGATKVEVTTLADVDEAVDLIVPELPVLKVEWTQVAPGRPGLRVLQRLSPTDTLEVRFVRSGGAAADALENPLAAVMETPLPAGLSQVVRVHRDGWLVARAPLSPVELEALVDRVGSPRSR